MCINSVSMPIIKLMEYALRVVYRRQDQAVRGQTHSKTQIGYRQIHFGPKYYIAFQYSFLMTLIFMAMIYGLALPILYPITLVTLIVFYYLEISMIYYSYRMPPEYDEEINNGCLQILYKAPLVASLMSIWMLSNL